MKTEFYWKKINCIIEFNGRMIIFSLAVKLLVWSGKILFRFVFLAWEKNVDISWRRFSESIVLFDAVCFVSQQVSICLVILTMDDFYNGFWFRYMNSSFVVWYPYIHWMKMKKFIGWNWSEKKNDFEEKNVDVWKTVIALINRNLLFIRNALELWRGKLIMYCYRYAIKRRY